MAQCCEQGTGKRNSLRSKEQKVGFTEFSVLQRSNEIIMVMVVTFRTML